MVETDRLPQDGATAEETAVRPTPDSRRGRLDRLWAAVIADADIARIVRPDHGQPAPTPQGRSPAGFESLDQRWRRTRAMAPAGHLRLVCAPGSDEGNRQG